MVDPVDALAACDFCSEFRGGRSTEFHKIYGDTLRSRIVDEADGLVVVPSLGQLFPGHLLVLPKNHVEMFARCASSIRASAEKLARRLVSVVAADLRVAIFEHGATKQSGRSCGVYHAHLHIVPLARRLAPEAVLPEARAVSASISQAFQQLSASDQYLLYGDGFEYRYLSLDAGDQRFPSQVLRRRVSELCGTDRSWDWRATLAPEASVLETIARFRKIGAQPA